MTDSGDTDTYALKSTDLPEIAAPDVDYGPPAPKKSLTIGLVGTGGISNSHLDAYRTAGWTVGAMWNRTKAKAEEKAKEFCPNAKVADDWQELLSDPAIEVLDIALPTEVRAPIIRAALESGKHVLSQKPFVADLDEGEELVELADKVGRVLAVNQNGRWSPHMSYMRNVVQSGLIGDVVSVHTSIHWDHGWTAGTPFDEIENLILYDFGIHWFDFVSSLVGDRLETVSAQASKALGQTNRAPLLAQAIVRFSGGQASLVFDGGLAHGPRDTAYVGGTTGSILSEGPDLGQQEISLFTSDGVAHQKLDGQWFNDGFRGAMGELMCAVEENRDPNNSAKRNLCSLELAFAAAESRRTGREIEVGSVRRL